jgi:hypothetical protein
MSFRQGVSDRGLNAFDACEEAMLMLGPEAGEVMAAVQTAMLAGLPYTVLRDAVLAHPTVAEGLGPLLSKLVHRPRG